MERFDTVILGGRVVSSEGISDSDIGIRGGLIVAVGDLLGSEADHVVDAKGLHIFPGAIDTQVHFREPGMEHKEDLRSGTLSAICGGVTTIFEMPNTNPTTTSAEALADKLARADGRAYCDFGFFVGAATGNLDELAALELLDGTPGIKMFAGSSTGDLLVDGIDNQRRALQNGSHVMPIHSEDEARLRDRKTLFGENPHVRVHPEIRDAEAARLSTERLIGLCEETGRPIHILHVSTKEELPLLRDAKSKGLPVTCEVTPHHLTLNSELYETLGTKIQMNPPVRSEDHRVAIWEAVKEGLFDVFGSDHAPHTLEEKAKPYPASPSGMPGVQTLFPVMLDWSLKGEMPLTQLVKMMMERPAELYGIERKGHIKTGFDADLVLVDLESSWLVTDVAMKTKSRWTPYAGMSLRGVIRDVFLHGELVVQTGEPLMRPVGRAVTYNWK
jgi:dihydroorotase